MPVIGLENLVLRSNTNLDLPTIQSPDVEDYLFFKNTCKEKHLQTPDFPHYVGDMAGLLNTGPENPYPDTVVRGGTETG